MPQKRFFSIVVPAHNEANYVGNTLHHLKTLDYPADKFEVIVVENSSSDATFELAKKFEGNSVRVLQSGKGVSRAKNAGIDLLSQKSDWVIFLDADTLLKKEFLNELNVFLGKPNKYCVGTVSLRPLPETLYARLWFFLHNAGHMATRTSFAILIVRRSLFPQLRFDERLAFGEDLDLIRKAQKHGRFFYLWTKNVLTSTRRFEQVGWWRLTFQWTIGAMLPVRMQKNIEYETVR